MKTRQMTLIQQLNDRGLIAQASNIEQMQQQLDDAAQTVYCGFDPTAGSLHKRQGNY